MLWRLRATKATAPTPTAASMPNANSGVVFNPVVCAAVVTDPPQLPSVPVIVSDATEPTSVGVVTVAVIVADPEPETETEEGDADQDQPAGAALVVIVTVLVVPKPAQFSVYVNVEVVPAGKVATKGPLI
jgi:hypothetical protein